MQVSGGGGGGGRGDRHSPCMHSDLWGGDVRLSVAFHR